jgi:hypothetical protein
MSNLPFNAEDLARRKRRALFMAIGLGILVVVFFVSTVVRLGGNVAMGGHM